MAEFQFALAIADHRCVGGNQRRFTIFSEHGFHNAIAAETAGAMTGCRTDTERGAIFGAIIAFLKSFAASVATDGWLSCWIRIRQMTTAITVTGVGHKIRLTIFPQTGFNHTISAISSFNATAVITAIIILHIPVVTFFITFLYAIATNVGTRGTSR